MRILLVYMEQGKSKKMNSAVHNDQRLKIKTAEVKYMKPEITEIEKSFSKTKAAGMKRQATHAKLTQEKGRKAL